MKKNNLRVLVLFLILVLAVFLVPKISGKGNGFLPRPSDSSASGKKKVLYYQHPMRPDITSPVPSKDEMGMDYTPVYEEGSAAHEGSAVEGHAAITISPERQQLIGVQTARAESVPLFLTIRAAGRVAHDPELYNFLVEYREAVAAKKQLAESPLAEVRERAESLVRSVEFKLKHLGLTQEQMQGLLASEGGNHNLILPADSAWVYAEIYEYESELVAPGQTAEITTPAFPGKIFSGTVKTVDPILNMMSRTLKVRIFVPEAKGILRPEMFVDVLLKAPLGTKLAIPADAVLDSGRTKFVFVDQGEGRLEPREIKVGHEADGYYEVLEGLREGEAVVSSANFLIDSESRLRGAVKSFAPAKKENENSSSAASNSQSGHPHPS